jgi:hypothetical protein
MGGSGYAKGDDMKISLTDRSLYLKGLMLLIRKDREIRDEEKRIVMSIGNILGFDTKFCEDTIKDVLINKHIVDEPPHFSKPGIAECFIRDGLRVSLVDNKIHETELGWLEAVAQENGLSETWYKTSVEAVSDEGRPDLASDMEASRLEWE